MLKSKNPSGTIVTPERTTPDDQRGRVLRFPAARSAATRRLAGGSHPVSSGTVRSTTWPNTSAPKPATDYRHRMRMNFLTLVLP